MNSSSFEDAEHSRTPYLRFIDGAAQAAVPISTALELTYCCNLNCRHCYQLDHTRRDDELTTEQWLSVLESLANLGCLFLTITGGEPFTRPDAIEICRRARKMGFALRVFTNATLIDDHIADELAGLSLVGVEISIYGPSAEIHDNISHRPGSFDKTTAGVRRLVERGVSVVLKSPVMSTNAAHLNEMREMADGLGVDLRLDIDVVPCDDGSREPLKLRLSDEELASVLSIDWMKDRFVAFPAERPDPASDLCGAARRTCAISSTGEVYPCIQLPTSAGNLKENGFESVWRDSPLMRKYREMRVADLCQECRQCPRLNYCSRCGALALIEDGDFLGASSWACRVAAAKEIAGGRCAPGDVVNDLA